MQASIFLIVLGIAVVTHASINSPKGLHFVGVGYNLLEGNPEGGESSNGGVDPGLLSTRKVFKLTWDTKRLSVDKKYTVPDQVSFAPRQSCVETSKNEVFSGSKSYQEKLSVDVEANGHINALLWEVAFTLSSRFKQINKETSKYHYVFYEKKTMCNRGRVRYQLDLAPVKKFPVSNDFAAAVCVLPQYYDEKIYFNFIERWGTHIVVEVELGEKKIERKKSSDTEFTKYAMQNVENSVSLSGSFMGSSASLKVDVKKFRESMSKAPEFGEHEMVYTSGGPDMPEPIGLKLVPIDEAFNVNFYRQTVSQSRQCNHSQTMLQKRRVHVQKALEEYPRLKQAVQPVDPAVRIPLTWPQGTYGLPMPKSGCPKGAKFPWHKGTRFQDTEDTAGNNQWSHHYDLAGWISTNNMERKFCMKTQQKVSYNLAWPKGQYCIYKKAACPQGFHQGHIRWDDEDSDNGNHYGGLLPDGVYNGDTIIEYCCRNDGHATNAIMLPTDSPFVLFKFKSHLCQYVRGMRVREEYFQWDTENSRTSNYAGESFPDGTVNANILLYYCYYY